VQSIQQPRAVRQSETLGTGTDIPSSSLPVLERWDPIVNAMHQTWKSSSTLRDLRLSDMFDLRPPHQLGSTRPRPSTVRRSLRQTAERGYERADGHPNHEVDSGVQQETDNHHQQFFTNRAFHGSTAGSSNPLPGVTTPRVPKNSHASLDS